MKTYQILVIDWITKEVEKTEDFTGTEETLSTKLSELQEGYCQDEKPTVEEMETTSNGMNLTILAAKSDSDFSFIAVIRKNPKPIKLEGIVSANELNRK